jgi:hypothetical protein
MDRVNHAKLSFSSTLMTWREHSCDLYWEWGLMLKPTRCTVLNNCGHIFTHYVGNMLPSSWRSLPFHIGASLSFDICHHYILALNSFLCLNPLLVMSMLLFDNCPPPVLFFADRFLYSLFTLRTIALVLESSHIPSCG